MVFSCGMVNTPKNQGGIQGVTYPILSDFRKTISQDYDVLVEDETVGEFGASYRGLFNRQRWYCSSSSC